MLNRIAEVLGGSRSAMAVAVVASSALFGLAHFPQGPTGMIENAVDGALLCGVFLLSGRNLFAAILAHGITDSADVLLIYTRHYPGLH